jgi:hypothetical protein
MGINAFQGTKSPVDAISKALEVASTVYNIKHAAAANDLIQSKLASEKLQQDQTARLADPDSPESKKAQEEATMAFDLASKQGYVSPEKASAIATLVKGSPAQEGHTLEAGMVGPEKPAQEAVPGLSAQTLAKDQEISPFLALVKGEQAAKARQTGFDVRDNQLQERQDFAAHQRVLAKLKGDPQMIKRLGQYQNLSNALNNVVAADNLTPQQIDEFQQSVRANIGAGGGGVGEREHTYLNSLGLNAERFKQFVTGDPAQIAQDDKLVTHIKQLARLEQQNITNQMDKRINVLTAGNKSIYDRRPDYKSDLQDVISAAKDQFTQEEPPSVATHSPATSSDVGIPGVSSAKASNIKPHPQDSVAVQWAKANPKDPRSAKILMMNGAN